MIWLKQGSLARDIVLLVIGAIVTVLIAFVVDSLQDGIKHLTYTVQKTEGILKDLRQVNTGSKFFIDNNEISDFSILSIDLFNDTGESYSDVAIALRIDGKRSDLLSISHFDKNSNADGLRLSEDTTATQVIYRYVHPVVNDLTEKPFATIRLALRGNTIPSFAIEINHTGLEIEEQKAKTGMVGYISNLTGAITASLIVVILSLILSIARTGFRSKQIDLLYEHQVENLKKQTMDADDLRKVIDDLSTEIKKIKNVKKGPDNAERLD
jgi:hypothetical protein